MSKESSKGIPGIACQLAVVCRFTRDRRFSHLNKQTVGNFERQLHNRIITSDLTVCDNAWHV